MILSHKPDKRLCNKLRRMEPLLHDDMNYLFETRVIHEYAMKELRPALAQIGTSDKLLVSRLKRLPSIISKLTRYPTLTLHQMQDIGGIRIIFNNYEDLRNFEHGFLASGFASCAVRRNDYILEPKNDGYRSVHYVLKYDTRNVPYLKNIRCELQLRTKAQHVWATAVETLGNIDGIEYKCGWGSDSVFEFFRYAAALIPCYEEGALLRPHKQQFALRLAESERRTHVLDRLEHAHVETQGNYYEAPFRRITLDTTAKTTDVRSYVSNHSALSGYDTLSSANSVLAYVRNPDDVREAYPNYFLDASTFVTWMRDAIAKALN